jgi:two-component system sensor histidine kinase ChvG
VAQAREVRLVGEALSSVRPGERDALMMRIAKDTGGRCGSMIRRGG